MVKKNKLQEVLKKKQVQEILDSKKPSDKRILDPAHKIKGGALSNIQFTGDEKLVLIGASLGATIQVGKNYMRFDCWESRFVPDNPQTIEDAKRDLSARLRQELELQHQEAEEELIDDENN